MPTRVLFVRFPLIALSCAALITAAVASAQNPPGPVTNRPPATMSTGYTINRPPVHFVTVVENRPYSAERIFQRTTTLANSSQVSSSLAPEKLFRDSQGRTRDERLVGFEIAHERALPFVEIRDQVAGYLYYLDAQKKIAYRYALIRPVPKPVPEPQASAAPLPRTMNTTPASAAVTGSSSAVCCEQLGSLPSKTATAPQVAGPPPPKFSREDLGTQIIEGIECTGRRTTTTQPVGSYQNNDRPIVSVDEQWTSKYLDLVVLQKGSSPLSGESSMRLTNILTSEPDPGLFQVPADYKIVDGTGPVQIIYTYPRP